MSSVASLDVLITVQHFCSAPCVLITVQHFCSAPCVAAYFDLSDILLISSSYLRTTSLKVISKYLSRYGEFECYKSWTFYVGIWWIYLTFLAGIYVEI